MWHFVSGLSIEQLGCEGSWHFADELTLECAHLDPLAIGPGLVTARIGMSGPSGPRRPSHESSAKPTMPVAIPLRSKSARKSRGLSNADADLSKAAVASAGLPLFKE